VAATHGRGEVLAQLLEWAPEAVGSPDDAGATPLRLAAEFAHPQLVLLLAQRGARVRSGSDEGGAGAHVLRPRRGVGDTPLGAAAASGDVATCATLLALGARGTRRGPVAAAASVAARRRRVASAAAAALRHAVAAQEAAAAAAAAAADDRDGLPPPPPLAAAAAVAAAERAAAERTAAYAARATLAATRAAAAAAAATLLRTAAAGVPLLWSFSAHAAFPPPFRAAVRDALRALHASPLRELPLPLRERILSDVFACAAAATVWHCIDAPTWALVARADALRAARGDPPAQARTLRTRASASGDSDASASAAAAGLAAAAGEHGDGSGSSSDDADLLDFTDDEEDDAAGAAMPPLQAQQPAWPLAFVPGFQAPHAWEGGAHAWEVEAADVDGEFAAEAQAAAQEDHLMAEY
jgi:hypothetical protein